MFSTHHPKLEHIGPMQFKWITEVVVQLHTGIIALNLLCAMCLTSCNADTLKVLAVVWGTCNDQLPQRWESPQGPADLGSAIGLAPQSPGLLGGLKVGMGVS